MAKWRAYCCSTSTNEAFECWYETDEIPRNGDTVCLYSDEHDFVCEMDVSSINWQLENGTLIPNVHMHPNGECTPDDFRAFGWESA